MHIAQTTCWDLPARDLNSEIVTWGLGTLVMHNVFLRLEDPLDGICDHWGATKLAERHSNVLSDMS